MIDRPMITLGKLRSNHTRAMALREIAEILRSGRADQHFLDLLANTLDPEIKKPIAGVKLVPKNTQKGAPKSFNVELAKFLLDKSDGEYLDAAVAEAVVEFKVSERTCWNVLAELNMQHKLRDTYFRLIDKENK